VNQRPVEPRGGEAPPSSACLGDDEPLDLIELAREICRRCRAEFPDEQERYGSAGVAVVCA
jgi:hypothetical protein